jgi:hypothetical protein
LNDLEDLANKIETMWDRDAILQCMHRYARGVDRFDRDLILSAFHPDCIDEHGKFVGTPDEFVDWALQQHESAHLSHQHCILNHSAEIDGNTAHTETYFMFVSMNTKGHPVTIGGGRYVDRLEKIEGEWRIAARVTLRDWSMKDSIPDLSDLSSLTSTSATLTSIQRAFMNAGRRPTRDERDPSYDRPLIVPDSRRQDYLAMTSQE